MVRDSSLYRALAKVGPIQDIRTYTELKDKMGPQELNVFNTLMNQRMTTEDRKTFKVASEEKRMAWIKQYIVDPKDALLKGYNKVILQVFKKKWTDPSGCMRSRSQIV